MLLAENLVSMYLDFATGEGIWSGSKEDLKFYLSYLFNGISFIGKSMLDIGGGSGLFSFFAAITGAKEVIVLEPESKGSAREVSTRFKQLLSSLPSTNITLQRVRFQDYDAGNKSFDIILLHNSINHLDEEACIKLGYNDVARKSYRVIFNKLSRMASSGAKLIICDCSPHNFFATLGTKNPFAHTIDWYKHQPPQLWYKMLSEYDFVNPKVRWASFSRFGSIGRFVLGNKFASYFLTSHFCLVMEKKRAHGPKYFP